MNIRLNKIRLKNFKGVKSFELIPQGKDVSILGDNGTGKTTLFDAFLWLLFGKDSKGKSDFAVKPLDPEGNPIHNLEVEVEAELEIDRQILTLKKVMKEKWTKKRGSAKETFTGHVFNYFVDGVPTKKKDWDARLQNIAPEETFKLITNPFAFPCLHWTKKRELLMGLFGDIKDREVIEGDKILSPLEKIISKHSIYDYIKIIKNRQKEINKRLQEIPVRIDELLSNQPVVEDEQKILKEIQEIEQALKNRPGIEEILKKRQALMKHVQELESSVQDKEIKLKNELALTENEIKIKDKQIAALIVDKKTIEKQLQDKRDEYKEIYAQKPKVENICPTCKRPFEQEMLDKILKNLEKEKIEKLEEIKKEGLRLKEKFEDISKQIKVLEQDKERLGAKLKEINSKLNKLTSSEHVLTLNKKRADLERLNKQIENFQEQEDNQTKPLKDKLEELKTKLASIKAGKQIKERIEALKSEQKNLVGQYEKLEKELFLCEKFVVRKVELLENKINGKFKLAKFKLFEQQINGGIVECCEIMFQGVPFDKGLNRGAQINVGLDIINTLSECYDFGAPIFIDNAEAVTSLIKTKGQQIRLYVKEGQTLTIKREE